jgi:hypothetical protein
MTSYLRSWLYSGTSDAEHSQPDVPSIERVSPPPDEDDDGEDTETERDYDDRPPAFPAMNSAQRASTSTPVILSDSQLMPPPPIPSLAVRQPGVPLSKGNTLAVPPRTEKPPVKPSKRREKVALAPGYGPLDWAALKSSGADLRVRTFLIYLTGYFGL